MTYHLQFGVLLQYLPTLLDGLWITLWLAVLGIFLGFALGVLGAVASVSSIKTYRIVCRVYVEFFRNTPMLIQLLVLFFGLPALGIRLSPLIAASLALILNNTAYIMEIVRGGILSTDKGQYEAAESLGLTRGQALRFVVLPPAIEKVFSPIVSQSVLLMLSTSIVSTIGVPELTGAAMQISSDTFRALELYLSLAIIYVLLNYIFRAALTILWQALFKKTGQKRLFQRVAKPIVITKLDVRSGNNA